MAEADRESSSASTAQVIRLPSIGLKVRVLVPEPGDVSEAARDAIKELLYLKHLNRRRPRPDLLQDDAVFALVNECTEMARETMRFGLKFETVGALPGAADPLAQACKPDTRAFVDTAQTLLATVTSEDQAGVLDALLARHGDDQLPTALDRFVAMTLLLNTSAESSRLSTNARRWCMLQGGSPYIGVGGKRGLAYCCDTNDVLVCLRGFPPDILFCCYLLYGPFQDILDMMRVASAWRHSFTLPEVAEATRHLLTPAGMLAIRKTLQSLADRESFRVRDIYVSGTVYSVLPGTADAADMLGKRVSVFDGDVNLGGIPGPRAALARARADGLKAAAQDTVRRELTETTFAPGTSVVTMHTWVRSVAQRLRTDVGVVATEVMARILSFPDSTITPAHACILVTIGADAPRLLRDGVLFPNRLLPESQFMVHMTVLRVALQVLPPPSSFVNEVLHMQGRCYMLYRIVLGAASLKDVVTVLDTIQDGAGMDCAAVLALHADTCRRGISLTRHPAQGGQWTWGWAFHPSPSSVFLEPLPQLDALAARMLDTVPTAALYRQALGFVSPASDVKQSQEDRFTQSVRDAADTTIAALLGPSDSSAPSDAPSDPAELRAASEVLRDQPAAQVLLGLKEIGSRFRERGVTTVEVELPMNDDQARAVAQLALLTYNTVEMGCLQRDWEAVFHNRHVVFDDTLGPPAPGMTTSGRALQQVKQADKDKPLFTKHLTRGSATVNVMSVDYDDYAIATGEGNRERR
jgi:hypothetical protein